MITIRRGSTPNIICHIPDSIDMSEITNMAGTAATGTLTWGVTGTQIYSSIFAPYGSWYVKVIMSIGSDNNDIPNIYMTNES